MNTLRSNIPPLKCVCLCVCVRVREIACGYRTIRWNYDSEAQAVANTKSASAAMVLTGAQQKRAAMLQCQ